MARTEEERLREKTVERQFLYELVYWSTDFIPVVSENSIALQRNHLPNV